MDKMKKLKRITSLVMSACLLLTAIYIPYDCFAEITSGTCGENAFWEYDDSTGTLTISGTGNMTTYSSSSDIPWKGMNVITAKIDDGITNICEYFLIGCKTLESVEISDTVFAIGKNAFSSCTNLKTVSFGTGVRYCNSDAFYDCKSIEEVNITDIGAWCNTDFDNICSNPLWYGSGLYLNGSLVTDITVPNRVGSWCFGRYNYLKSVIFEDGATSASQASFSDCANLTSVTFSDTVKTIGISAFSNCISLTEINLPKSITSISSAPFGNCKNLTIINIDESNENYASLDGVLYNKDFTKLVAYPPGKEGQYNMPNTVSYIPSDAFSNCKGLTDITISENLTSLTSGSFWGCSGLTEVILPVNVNNIAQSVFRNCNNLKSIYILNSSCRIYNSDSIYSNTVIYGHPNSTAQSYAEKYNRTFIPLCIDGTKNHTFEVTTTATCTTDGLTTYSCNVCGYSYDEPQSALGHIEVIDDAVEPDCTHTGLSEGSHCSVCNEVLLPQTNTDALGHSYTKEVITPTCSQQGYTVYTCERCGDSYKDDFIDTTAHSFTYYVSDGNATCTADGTKTASCDRCSATDTITDFGSMLPHSCEWRIVALATQEQEGVEEYYCTVCNTVIGSRAIPVLEPVEENEAPLEPIEDKEIVIDATSSLTTSYDDFRVVSGLGCAKVAWSADDSTDGYLVYTSSSPDEDFELVGAVENNEADFCVIQNLARSSIMYIRIVAYKTENDKLIQYPENKTKKVFIK